MTALDPPIRAPAVEGKPERLFWTRRASLTARILAVNIIALGLMAAGAGLKLSALASNKLLAGELLLIRHAIQPLIAFAMVKIFKLNQPQAIALMAFSSLPTASSCYVLAVRMGHDGAFVAGLVSLSTLLGTLSLPFALSLIGV